MKRRSIIFIVIAAIIVILIITAVLIFSPRRIVNKSDYIVGMEIKYHDSEVPADQNSIIEILSKYEAVTSLNDYFPCEIDKIDFEINFVDNNKPVHMLLGNINVWYESADGLAHDIINAGKLEDELKCLLNIK